MDSLRDVLVLAFWAWLIVSVVLLVRRSLDKDKKDDDSAAAVGGGGDPGTGAPAAFSAPTSPTTQTPTAPASPPTAPPAAAAPAGGSIFDTDASAPGAPSNARPISEMVAGVSLPCDLAPVMNYVRRNGVREQVVFSTSGYTVTDVGGALGDELRRLGFELQAVTQTEVVATRETDVLRIGVIGDAEQLMRENGAAFPALPAGAVVVELWTD